MCSDTSTLLSLFRLAQLADSTFPVGAFSFSMGLEAAVERGLVATAEDLEEYARGALYGAAECDGVALLEAFRAARNGDHSRLIDADLRVISLKAGEEVRTMTLRMGHRLAGLLSSIAPTHLSSELERWIEEGVMVGSYPVVQAVAGVVLGVREEALYAAHLYGVAQTVLSAALRLMRISHFDSQRILMRLGPLCEGLYDHYGELTLEDMTSCAPTLALTASLHERGEGRLFMN